MSLHFKKLAGAKARKQQPLREDCCPPHTSTSKDNVHNAVLVRQYKKARAGIRRTCRSCEYLDSAKHEGYQLTSISNQVAGSEFPGHYPGEDHSWNLQKFKQVRLADVREPVRRKLIYQIPGPCRLCTTFDTINNRVRPSWRRCVHCQCLEKNVDCRGKLI